MRRGGLLPLLLLGGCGERAAEVSGTPGARLEAAAVAQGLVVDPAGATLVGVWGRDTDRLCVVGLERGAQRIGASVDYGEGQGCTAAGTVRRNGARLTVDLGKGCAFDARFDGERVVFPAALPNACEAACRGRASLAALDVERISEAASEAASLRAATGRLLCAD